MNMKHINKRQQGQYCIIELDHQSYDYNVIDLELATEFCEAMQLALDDDGCSGIIFTSAKSGFCSGADIKLLAKMDQHQEEVQTIIKQMHDITYQMESSNKPIVAVVTGSAVGGGFEMLLACQHIIVANEPKGRYGLPEIKLGIFPGFGGSQRLPRMIGVQKSLEMMLKGRVVPADKALAMGMVHELVEPSQMMDKAVAYLDSNPDGVSPWVKPNFKLKDQPHSASGLGLWSAAITLARVQAKGHYPAVKALLSSVYEGLQLDMVNALTVERNYFMTVLKNPIPMHLIGLYLNQKHVTKPLDKHEKIERIAVIGAGLMGSGIASVSALAGLKVTVIDTSMEKSQQAMDYLNKLLNSELKRKRKTKSEAEAIRDNLTCSDQLSAIKGCQVVIEAVFESIEVKSKLFKEIEPWLESNTVIASNTSSIPISEMAHSVKDQGRFVGMHFFSPVEKMALVEIIQGEKTTAGTIEMIKTLTLMIKKTPIVVNDGCGFYTTRVFARYPQEAIICLEEGIHPAMIEQSGRQAGMPMGPLEISDAVGLDVMAHIMTVAKQYKVYSDDTNCEGVINELLKQQRMGKKNKQGFYDYSSGAASLWKGSYGWVKDGKQIDLKSLSERLLYGQLVEAMKCWHESILDDKQSGDLGAVLGWGFAPYTGGPLSLISQIGWDVFIEKSKDMANRYGKRFQLPEGMKKPNFIK